MPNAVLLPLSARTPKALRELAQRYVGWLPDHQNLPLASVCATASHGRSHFPYRIAVAGHSHHELADSLRRWLASDNVVTPARDLTKRIAFLFTGQGAQYASMGKKLMAWSATFRAEMEHCAEVLRDLWPWSLLHVLEDEALLERTDVAQPAVFALEYALARTWQAWGIEPAAVLGHSAGEYVAACIAEVFSLADGLRLIVERGRAMQACPTGAMLACFASLEEIETIMHPWGDRLALAANNGPKCIVLAGDAGAVTELQTALNDQGIACTRLAAGRAFHSKLIEPALADLQQAAGNSRAPCAADSHG